MRHTIPDENVTLLNANITNQSPSESRSDDTIVEMYSKEIADIISSAIYSIKNLRMNTLQTAGTFIKRKRLE
jgi:hypothetical protein